MEGAEGGFLSAVAINMSSRRGPPSSQNRMTGGGLKREDGRKRGRDGRVEGSDEGVQDKHGLDSAGDTSRGSQSGASVGSETKRNGESKKKYFVATSLRFCDGVQPTQRNPVDPSNLKSLAPFL